MYICTSKYVVMRVTTGQYLCQKSQQWCKFHSSETSLRCHDVKISRSCFRCMFMCTYSTTPLANQDATLMHSRGIGSKRPTQVTVLLKVGLNAVVSKKRTTKMTLSLIMTQHWRYSQLVCPVDVSAFVTTKSNSVVRVIFFRTVAVNKFCFYGIL